MEELQSLMQELQRATPNRASKANSRLAKTANWMAQTIPQVRGTVQSPQHRANKEESLRAGFRVWRRRPGLAKPSTTANAYS